MKRIMLVIQGLVLLHLLVACSIPNVQPTPLLSPVIPTPDESTSPIPTAVTAMTSEILAPGFRLDPLTADSKEATGQGPIGFTLVVVDATSGAHVLGSGESDKDGNFRIPLSEAPRRGHLMGLTVDLTSDQLASEDLMRKLYDIRGPGFRFIPQVVIIYDAVEVPEN